MPSNETNQWLHPKDRLPAETTALLKGANAKYKSDKNYDEYLASIATIFNITPLVVTEKTKLSRRRFHNRGWLLFRICLESKIRNV